MLMELTDDGVRVGKVKLQLGTNRRNAARQERLAMAASLEPQVLQAEMGRVSPSTSGRGRVCPAKALHLWLGSIPQVSRQRAPEEHARQQPLCALGLLPVPEAAVLQNLARL